MPYRTFEHTADVGIEVDAPDLAALFADAGRAFRELSVDAGDLVPTDEPVELAAAADDLPGLLVAWLEELLFLWDARGVMVVDLEVALEGEERVRGRGRRAALRPEADALTDIKAVTWHGLTVEPAAGGWRARVIFDI
jgi:SHS2 domain-containing protein